MPERDGVAEAERIADGQHHVADLQVLRVAERDRRQVVGIGLQYGDVRLRIGAADLRRKAAAVASTSWMSSAPWMTWWFVITKPSGETITPEPRLVWRCACPGGRVRGSSGGTAGRRPAECASARPCSCRCSRPRASPSSRRPRTRRPWPPSTGVVVSCVTMTLPGRPAGRGSRSGRSVETTNSAATQSVQACAKKSQNSAEHGESIVGGADRDGWGRCRRRQADRNRLIRQRFPRHSVVGLPASGSNPV